MPLESLLYNFYRVMHYSVQNALKRSFIQDTDIGRNFLKNIALLCTIVEKLEFSTKCLDGLMSSTICWVYLISNTVEIQTFVLEGHPSKLL